MVASCVTYLEILHAHGLTLALLERFASFVAQEKVGVFMFHTGPGGKILAYEEHHKSPVSRLELLTALEEHRDGKSKRGLP